MVQKFWIACLILLGGIIFSNSVHAADTDSIWERDPEVPDLPFPDNLDPSQCGIPTIWANTELAWVTGYFDGKLVQPTVFLYDSHSRMRITGRIPTGTQVKIKLYQHNPSLDYYLVRSLTHPPQEGWIPAPFLEFESPSD